jgi:hypothetical protein
VATNVADTIIPTQMLRARYDALRLIIVIGCSLRLLRRLGCGQEAKSSGRVCSRFVGSGRTTMLMMKPLLAFVTAFLLPGCASTAPDPALDPVVAQLGSAAKLILIGEIHGTVETPAAFGRIAEDGSRAWGRVMSAWSCRRAPSTKRIAPGRSHAPAPTGAARLKTAVRAGPCEAWSAS